MIHRESSRASVLNQLWEPRGEKNTARGVLCLDNAFTLIEGLPDAREFIAGVREKGRELAYRAIFGLQAELDERGYQLTRSALLLASGRPLPELEKILASHALIHTADGELFRECLLHASGRCGLGVLSIRERELFEQASKALRMPRPSLLRRVTELGRPFGSPWTQDEKFATLAAWLVVLLSR